MYFPFLLIYLAHLILIVERANASLLNEGRRIPPWYTTRNLDISENGSSLLICHRQSRMQISAAP